jgi:hypothetical protein
VEMADLVTEMRLVKHPYRDQGIGAQRSSCNKRGSSHRGTEEPQGRRKRNKREAFMPSLRASVPRPERRADR